MTTPLGSNHEWHLRCLLQRAIHPWNWKAGKLRSMGEMQVPKVRHNLLYTTPINSVRNAQLFKLPYGPHVSGHHYLHKNSEASSKCTKLHTKIVGSVSTSPSNGEKKDQTICWTQATGQKACLPSFHASLPPHASPGLCFPFSSLPEAYEKHAIIPAFHELLSRANI